MDAPTDPHEIIARLQLVPHPEGGWYRETWRADAPAGARAGGTAILFLLEGRQRSHWHRVNAEELWLWHAGAPLRLLTAPGDDGPVTEARLGPNILAGHAPQSRIPSGHWQAAEADAGWALLSCIVVPGFEFVGFSLAPAGWAPGTMSPAG